VGERDAGRLSSMAVPSSPASASYSRARVVVRNQTREVYHIVPGSSRHETDNDRNYSTRYNILITNTQHDTSNHTGSSKTKERANHVASQVPLCACPVHGHYFKYVR